MPLRTPAFWKSKGLLAWLLWPLSWFYRGYLRGAGCCKAKPYHSKLPLICIGNAIAGGAGKTPVCLAIGKMLQEAGYRVMYISRGYGGSATGVTHVLPHQHSAAEVGDESLLLAKQAPTFIARRRKDAVLWTEEADADILIMDDGLQNESIAKTCSLLVINGSYGIGNGFVLPAGPLREPFSKALTRADAIIMIGEDKHGIAGRCHAIPCFYATLQAQSEGLKGDKPAIAFAGIAHPENFFATLRQEGVELVETVAFADHHPYEASEIEAMIAKAKALEAMLVTTEKDMVKIPEKLRADIKTLPVSIAFADAGKFKDWLASFEKGKKT